MTEPDLPAGSTFDPATLDRVWTEALDELLTDWDDLSSDQQDDLLEQVEAAVEAGDPAMLAEVDPDTGPSAELLTAALVALLVVAAALAIVEALAQGASIPGLPDLDDDTRDRWASGELEPDERDLIGTLVLSDAQAAWVDSYAVATAARLGRGLANTVTETAVRLWQDDAAAAVGAAVRAELADQPTTWLRSALGASLHTAASTGRHATFELAEAPAGKRIVWVASETLDSNTCPACSEIDGTRFPDHDAALLAYPVGPYRACEGRWRCRGLAVPVWEAE